MNLELLQTFGQSFPEEYDGALDSVSVAVTAAFNRRGSLLAVGCNDGRIVVWDFLTRGIAKIISAHVHPVTSVSWSRNGRKLLSGSTDWTVSVWDVLSGECDQKYRFQSQITKVQFHPRNKSMEIEYRKNKFLKWPIPGANGRNKVVSKLLLVCPMKQVPVLVELEGSHRVLPSGGESEQNMVASFDRRGEYVYTGNSKGKVMVIDLTNLEVVTSFRIYTGTSANTAIKSIEFARRGSAFLINSQDRIIRVFDSQIVLSCRGTEGAEPEPIQKLQDLVNRTLWKKCCFAGDGEYICAGSSRTHALYIWEKGVGNLVKILHGTKGELLLDVVWHPIRPIIASISSGVVSIWAQNHVENWSAFAPDFKELDENVEYEEKESEFDIEDEDKEEEIHSGSEAGEEEEVDVVTVERIPALCSSDEEEDEHDTVDTLYFLPVAPEIDDPEETGNETEDYSKDPEQKRRASQADATADTPRKKVKVIDIRHEEDHADSRRTAVSQRFSRHGETRGKVESHKNKKNTSSVATEEKQENLAEPVERLVAEVKQETTASEETQEQSADVTAS